MSKFLNETGLAKVWAKVKSYVTSAIADAVSKLTKSDVGLGNVTNDAQVKRSEMGVASGVATLGTDGKLTAAQLPAMKTVNGESVVGNGDITIDLSLYKVVDSLPSTGIDANKIYLVQSGTTGTNNVYTEYMYVNGKWEKIGEYTAAVDLTPYVKFTDLASAAKAGAMSAEDYTLLHDKAEEVEYLIKNTIQGITVNGTSLETGDRGNTVDIPVATTSRDGVMSMTDKARLDAISELTDAEIEAICV